MHIQRLFEALWCIYISLSLFFSSDLLIRTSHLQLFTLERKKKSCCTITELDLLEHRYRPRKKPHAIKQKYSIYLAQLQGVSGNNLILHIHTAHHKLSAYTSEKMAKNTFPQFPHCCFCLANFKTYEGKAESVLLHCPQRKLIQGC